MTSPHRLFSIFINIFVDFEGQHTNFIWLVVHRWMGSRRLQTDCRDSSLRFRCVSPKRAREGGTTQLAISDASLPAKATRLRLPSIPTTSLSATSFLRLAVWTSAWALQLLSLRFFWKIHTRCLVWLLNFVLSSSTNRFMVQEARKRLKHHERNKKKVFSLSNRISSSNLIINAIG